MAIHHLCLVEGKAASHIPLLAHTATILNTLYRSAQMDTLTTICHTKGAPRFLFIFFWKNNRSLIFLISQFKQNRGKTKNSVVNLLCPQPSTVSPLLCLVNVTSNLWLHTNALERIYRLGNVPKPKIRKKNRV